ncbi:hypothetical protein QCD85_05195 [Paenibacillus sp. PsM32]|uniref:hypothetical protein n=1 Tax=Paenibacillus sp. PsM32 TaxID=3030536 RepID=UPI00263A8711|nr:hypothetical protein [Paenibacillus sp. PsM32]MDN4617481.1 hypothetical protein [Paenibacillus sp. PsM32]
MNRKKLILWVIIGIILIAVIGYLYKVVPNLLSSNTPSAEQQFYKGKIVSINKENSSIDGEKVLYSIQLDNDQIIAVTKNSHFFKITNNFNADPSLKFTQLREEINISELKKASEVEIWARQANTHLLEIYDLTEVPD